MNRRSFFKMIAVAAAGFTILPPATTYSRVWRASRQIVSMDLDEFREILYTLNQCRSRCYDQGYIDAMTDRPTATAIEKAFARTVFYNERIPKDLIT